jgi:hypothetical protein
MPKLLAELLDIPEVLIETAITKLEHLSGWQSTDVRLLAEANNKLRAKTKELGLDPEDTTGTELYYALQAKLAADEKSFNLGREEIIQKLSQVYKARKVYALRHGVAKDLLRGHPPKHLMKQLNYRSIDSMLKRENIVALYAALQIAESSRWHKTFWKDLSKLSPSDFETRQIEVVQIDAKRYKSLSNYSNTSPVELMGAVAVWPNTLSVMGLCVQTALNISKLREVCTYLKLKQVEPNFGKNLAEILQNEFTPPLEISHTPISWHTVFQHYGRRTAAEHTEYFGPHLLHEDIKAHYPLKSLSKISPVFNWWEGLEHVIKQTEDGLVSLNLADVLAGHPHNYKKRSIAHAQASLWHEFIDRYLDHPAVEQHFMQQLEPQTIAAEDLNPRTSSEEREIAQLMEQMA